MQGLDWNHLKFALAVGRAGTLAGAARLLGVDETTVGRRLRAMDAALGPIFERDGAGRYAATRRGQEVLDRAERVEGQFAAIAELAGRAGEGPWGTVRVTAVPIVANRILAPELVRLAATAPSLTIDLVPDARNLDLTKHEADLALRFARPVTGGLRIKARRIGTIAFAAYGPAAGEARGWIVYDDAHAGLPQARWLAQAAARDGAAPGLLVGDAETALEAAAAGLGRTLLPRRAGEADPRLRAAGTDGLPPCPARELWLLHHSDDAHRRAVAAAKRWLATLAW
jgi:DNA-binding transcriptional LysR family regulator